MTTVVSNDHDSAAVEDVGAPPATPFPLEGIAADLLDRLPNPILVKDEDLRLVLVNDAFCRLLGVSREQVLGARDRDLVPSEQADHFNARDRAVLASREIDECQEQLTSASGALHTLLTRKTRMIAADGRRYMVGVITDITERIVYQTRLEEQSLELARLLEEVSDAHGRTQVALAEGRQRQRLLEGAASVIGDAFALFDATGAVIFANPAFCRLHGANCLEGNLAGVSFASLVPRLRGTVRRGNVIQPLCWDDIARPSSTVALEIMLPEDRWLLARSRRTVDGLVVASFTDVSELKHKELALSDLAFRDPLTGLGNRSQFERLLPQAIAHGEGRNGPAVMLLDLDRFKQVNDTLGHQAGDLLLISVADRLREVVRKCDTLCRLGGDEFAVIVDPLSEPEVAARVAERILHALSLPFSLDGQRAEIGASIGVALANGEGGDPAELVRRADLALYAAKERGRNKYFFFEATMTTAVERRRQLESELRVAIRGEALSLVYQPQVDLRSNWIVGAEALVRWHTPDGWIGPAEFIPLAERSGLIHWLGMWVLRAVCEQIRSWLGQGLQPPTIAINISADEFARADFADSVVDVITQFGLPAGALRLEISEAVFIRMSKDAVEAAMRRLQTVGVTLSLDDFGAGCSSMALLRDLPIAELKIDPGFVRDLGREPRQRNLIAALIGLGHGLDMQVVAEGVESMHQAGVLRALGCDRAQGFCFARPASASRFAELLATPILSAVASDGDGTSAAV